MLQSKIRSTLGGQSFTAFCIEIKANEKSVTSKFLFNIKEWFMLFFIPNKSSYYQHKHHTYEFISINNLPFSISVYDKGLMSFQNESQQYKLCSNLMELNLKRHDLQNQCLSIYNLLSESVVNITEAGYLVKYDKKKLRVKFNLFDVFIDCPAHYAFDISGYFENKVSRLQRAYKVYKRGR